MNPIDVEEARRYTECSDCEQGLYVYDSRGYPEDTGAICFDCLAKRYEALRDAVKPGPSKRGVAAIIGQWPGDETDEDIERAMAEVDGKPEPPAFVWFDENPKVAGNYLSRLNGDDETIEWCFFTEEDLADHVHFYEGLQHAGPIIVKEMK